MPEIGFLPKVQRSATKRDLLILDDIRAGFRLAVGGSHTIRLRARSCYCKALGNDITSLQLLVENTSELLDKSLSDGSYWNDGFYGRKPRLPWEIQASNLPAHLEKVGSLLLMD